VQTPSQNPEELAKLLRSHHISSSPFSTHQITAEVSLACMVNNHSSGLYDTTDYSVAKLIYILLIYCSFESVTCLITLKYFSTYSTVQPLLFILRLPLSTLVDAPTLAFAQAVNTFQAEACEAFQKLFGIPPNDQRASAPSRPRGFCHAFS
jgi:hypothetical protein